MPPVTEIALVVGPMEPQTKRGFSGVEWRAQAARAIAADRRLSSQAWSERPYSPSTSGRAAEGVGLHDVAAGGEVALVDAVHHVGTGGAEVLVAPLELGAAEVGGGQGDPLERRAGGAVEHQDAGVEGRHQERGALVHVGGARGKRYVEDRIAHSLSSFSIGQYKKPAS